MKTVKIKTYRKNKANLNVPVRLTTRMFSKTKKKNSKKVRNENEKKTIHKKCKKFKIEMKIISRRKKENKLFIMWTVLTSLKIIDKIRIRMKKKLWQKLFFYCIVSKRENMYLLSRI